MADESIQGLLLRAHAECAAQAHGERYMHDNRMASAEYTHAVEQIAGAIKAVGMAEHYVTRQNAQKQRKEPL